jgi:hypothetical protein
MSNCTAKTIKSERATPQSFFQVHHGKTLIIERAKSHGIEATSMIRATIGATFKLDTRHIHRYEAETNARDTRSCMIQVLFLIEAEFDCF